MKAELRERIEASIDRVSQGKRELEGELARAPRLFYSAVLAVPVFFLWGALGAVLTVVAAGLLVATAYYLLYVRIREADAELHELRGELKGGEARRTGAANRSGRASERD